jgi:hypothetical protein
LSSIKFNDVLNKKQRLKVVTENLYMPRTPISNNKKKPSNQIFSYKNTELYCIFLPIYFPSKIKNCFTE